MIHGAGAWFAAIVSVLSAAGDRSVGSAGAWLAAGGAVRIDGGVLAAADDPA